MIRRIGISVLLAVFLGQGCLFAFSGYQEVKEYYASGFRQKDVEVVHNAAMDINLPTYIQPDPTQTNLDIKYRVGLLPTAYQGKSEYFVFPKAGIIVPVVNVSKQEREIRDQGKEIDYLKYLQRGAVHHRGKKPQHGTGNFVLAGHTSYLASDPGDFKTNMQGLFLADPDDFLIYAKKVRDDLWERYTYQVYAAYEVEATDVSILLTDPDVPYELTVYGCSPIGTTDKRRVVKAKLYGYEKVAITIPPTSGTFHAAADTQPTKVVTEEAKPIVQQAPVFSFNAFIQSVRNILTSRYVTLLKTFYVAAVQLKDMVV